MRKQKVDLAQHVLNYYDHFNDHDWLMIKVGAVAIPIAVFLILHLLNINYSLKIIIMSVVIALVFLLYAMIVFVWIIQKDSGTEDMQMLAESITEGSEGFFKAQYGTIFKLSFIFAFVIMIIYYTRTIQHDQMHQMMSNFSMAIFSGISFMLGAFCSGLSGYAGMWVSVRANVRVASASRKCYNEALQIAFKGGYFAALINIILAILGIALLFLILIIYLSFNESPTVSGLAFIDKIPLVIIGFGFGASFVAMFAQLGGGIYTKAADVGADLIGKVEAGIPEDDQRNPAVIADLVGDNVGDCAGQAADLFESISAEILSAMILGATLAHDAGFSSEDKASFMLFPFAVHILDMVASTIGMWFVHTKPGLPDYDATYGTLEDPLDIMKRGYKFAMGLGISGFLLICYLFLNPNNQGVWIYFSCCGVIGAIISFLFIEVTQYYTDYQHPPVKRIVAASKTGHATNIISGLSVGMESTGIPIVIIVIGLILSYYFGEASGIVNSKGEKIGGLFGTAIATMGMFSTGVYILSMSGFGPIADNAGGIAEMSHQTENVRRITDRLDAVGNVTKANTKGYSVGTASLACFLLFSAFIDEVNFISESKLTSVDITIPEVFLGGLLGSMCVFVFSSWALSAVGNAAQDVIKEVRGQFKSNPLILEGRALPNYKQCVEIVARAGLREMIKPGLLAVFAPIIVGLIFRFLGTYMGKELLGAKVVCAFLMFSTSTGILMALFLNNGGGAWDNAKKFIETGAVGGKGSEMHKAAVTGDTVGDPCKDTAGPSIHILIKLFSTITLVLAPLFIER